VTNPPPISDRLPSLFYSAVTDLAHLKKFSLPEGVALGYGCNNCEWKNLGLCPHKLKGDEVLPSFICDERAAYLKGFYRGENSNPGFTEWEADYAQGVAMKEFQRDVSIMRLVEDKVLRLEKELSEAEGFDPESDTTKHYRKALKIAISQKERAREHWFSLWKTLRHLQEHRLDREAPKKVEVTHRNQVSVDEFNKLMRRAEQGEVVDADYEVID
jgi:hypothetical protein